MQVLRHFIWIMNEKIYFFWLDIIGLNKVLLYLAVDTLHIIIILHNIVVILVLLLVGLKSYLSQDAE